jgi:small subunit ribosomal protein S18
MAYEEEIDGDFEEGGESGRPSPMQRRFFAPPQRSCNCKDIDYKNPERLRRFLHENGKIRPRRQTGLCAKCQRKLAREVKRARHLALLPFVGD